MGRLLVSSGFEINESNMLCLAERLAKTKTPTNKNILNQRARVLKKIDQKCEGYRVERRVGRTARILIKPALNC